jgi:hypothetical protein
VLPSRVPVTSFGSFKISDNGNPQPGDRAFVTYNYYDVDGFHANNSMVNRETIGFEKSFFDGWASFELRAPFTQEGESLGGSSDFSGLTLALKWAACIDRENGNVLSGGLAVTAPTGPDIPIMSASGAVSSINPTLIQPFIAYVFSIGGLYVEGFTEIVVPTDSKLSTFFGTDIGLGYKLETLPVIPTIELHANAGLNHQGSAGLPLGFVDQVILTGGFHTVFGKSLLTVGLATPVSGPNLYSIEGIVQFNFRF